MTTDVTQIGTARAEMLACLQQTMDGVRSGKFSGYVLFRDGVEIDTLAGGVICTSDLVAAMFRSVGLLIATELDGKAEVEE